MTSSTMMKIYVDEFEPIHNISYVLVQYMEFTFQLLHQNSMLYTITMGNGFIIYFCKVLSQGNVFFVILT
jgi:hypothetical protein